jgi:hypothetical protein
MLFHTALFFGFKSCEQHALIFFTDSESIKRGKGEERREEDRKYQ